MTGEMAIPLKSLKDAGIELEKLQIVVGQHLGKYQGNQRGWVFRDLAFENRSFETENYMVRLHFAEPDDVKPGERVFDIILQDKVIAKDFDIIKAAGGKNKALIKEFKNIKAGKKLTLLLREKSNKSTSKTVPLLNAIEIIKNKKKE